MSTAKELRAKAMTLIAQAEAMEKEAREQCPHPLRELEITEGACSGGCAGGNSYQQIYIRCKACGYLSERNVVLHND